MYELKLSQEHFKTLEMALDCFLKVNGLKVISNVTELTRALSEAKPAEAATADE